MRISDWSSDGCSSDLERQLLRTVELGVGLHVAEGDAQRTVGIGVHRPALVLAVVGNRLQVHRACQQRVAGARLALGLALEPRGHHRDRVLDRSEEHKSELQSLMSISYDVFCLKKKN